MRDQSAKVVVWFGIVGSEEFCPVRATLPEGRLVGTFKWLSDKIAKVRDGRLARFESFRIITKRLGRRARRSRVNEKSNRTSERHAPRSVHSCLTTKWLKNDSLTCFRSHSNMAAQWLNPSHLSAKPSHITASLTDLAAVKWVWFTRPGTRALTALSLSNSYLTN